MSLRLYRDTEAFAAALEVSSGLVYSICNGERLEPAELMRLERCAADRGHREILEVESLRADALRDIEAFFREAGRIDPEWRFAYSSKVVLSISGYQDLQKIFLLRRYFEAQPSADVLLLVSDRRLHDLFRAVFTGSNAKITALPGVKAWVRCARTLLRAFANRAAEVRADALVFTLSSGVPGAADAYFGKLAAVLGRKTPTLTVYLSSGGAVRLPSDAARVPLEAFVSAFDVIRAWVSAYASGFKAASAPDAHSDLAPVHRYIRGAEIATGEYFMQHVLAAGFARMLERIRPRLLVYPFENRSFEKRLVATARATCAARTIGYQHSSITPRHLAFHVAEREIARENVPDRVVTIGDVTAHILQTVAPGFAHAVESAVSLRAARQHVSDAGAPAVLVAISSSRNEALRLLQVTHAAARQSAASFIVRTHPTIPIGAMFALFAWPPNVELSSGTTLAQDLSRVTLVAYSSSTVALEGMLYGRLPIFVDIGDVPDGDPLSGDHAFKRAVRDGAGLAAAVEHVSQLDSGRLERLRSEARDYAERYLRAPSEDAVERMADRLLAA